jgi:Tfp pilus assembly protein PilF
VKFFRLALERNLSCAKSHYCLAVISDLRHDRQEAQWEYQQAIDIDPKYVKAHLNLADNYSHFKDSEAALLCLRKAAEADPNHPGIYQRLGPHFMEKKEYRAAAEAFQLLVALQPKSCKAHNSLGNALR